METNPFIVPVATSNRHYLKVLDLRLLNVWEYDCEQCDPTRTVKETFATESEVHLFNRVAYLLIMDCAQIIQASFLGQECGFHSVPYLKFL